MEFFYQIHIQNVIICRCLGNARVAELVDALDLGSSASRRESSSLSFRTMFNFITSSIQFFYDNLR